MKLKNPLKRKNPAPYYGGTNTLASMPAVPLRREEQAEPIEKPKPATFPTEADWEQRRFELMKMLVAQDRRSVVLGKSRASNRQIVKICRELSDAAIEELRTHPMQSHDKGREKIDGAVV